MISPTPGLPDSSGVYNLIALITDPASAKKRMDDLAQILTDISARHADVEQLSIQAAADNAAAQAALATATQVHDEQENTLSVRQKQLNDFSEQLASKQTTLHEQEARLTTLTNTFEVYSAEQTVKLNTREASLASRESEVTQREAAVSVLKNQYNAKVEALQAALVAQPKSLTMQADTGTVGNTMGQV